MAHVIRMDQGLRLDAGLRFDQMVPDASGPMKGTKHMSDIMPAARTPYGDWLLNAKEQSAIQGPLIGATPESVTALQAACTAQLARMATTDTKDAAFQAAQGAEADGRKLADAEIRNIIASWKLLPGWNSAAAAALQAVSSKPAFDPLTYKTVVKVRITGGEIRLDWTKKGVWGVHVYARLAGQTVWVKIGTDTSSPYIDGRPLAVAGVAETREYMLRGCDRDEKEIGLESDIVTIVYKG